MAQRFSKGISRRGGQTEPTLPLINIVFLMLIFFLVSAQLARPIDPDLQLAETDHPELTPPPDAVVLDQAGKVTFRGIEQPYEAIFTALQAEAGDTDVTVRILPDRRSDALALTALTAELRGLGASRVSIVTQRGLE